MKNLGTEKEDAIRNGDMKGASLLHHEQEELRKKLEQRKKRLQRRNSQKQITVKERTLQM